MYIDDQKILCAQPSKENETKKYTHICNGYPIHGIDKQAFVRHKKQRKILPLKQLGDGMGVVTVWSPLPHIPDHISAQGALTALGIFRGFDEETGIEYCFLPYISPSKIDILYATLSQAGLQYLSLVHTPKGICVHLEPSYQRPAKTNNSFDLPTLGDILSFLYVLSIVYGKCDIRNNTLFSIQAFIPIFGAYTFLTQALEAITTQLQQDGIFIVTKSTPSQVHIQSSDYDLLQYISLLHQNTTQITSIAEKEKTQIAINALMENVDILDKNDMLTILSSQRCKIIYK